jgi:hypothetical protein
MCFLIASVAPHVHPSWAFIYAVANTVHTPLVMDRHAVPAQAGNTDVLRADAGADTDAGSYPKSGS